MTPPKPIPTYYQGTWYRSRLEASYAVNLTEHGVPFDYEPQAVVLSNGETYWPDFRLPGLGWLEVKGAHGERLHKPCLLAQDTGQVVLIGRDASGSQPPKIEDALTRVFYGLAQCERCDRAALTLLGPVRAGESGCSHCSAPALTEVAVWLPPPPRRARRPPRLPPPGHPMPPAPREHREGPVEFEPESEPAPAAPVAGAGLDAAIEAAGHEPVAIPAWAPGRPDVRTPPEATPDAAGPAASAPAPATSGRPAASRPASGRSRRRRRTPGRWYRRRMDFDRLMPVGMVAGCPIGLWMSYADPPWWQWAPAALAALALSTRRVTGKSSS